jgi:zinc transport system permease protein
MVLPALPEMLPLAFFDGVWLDEAVAAFSRQFPSGHFFSLIGNVKGLLALILVSLCCGAVGSLVVGGRMAFFSDALAHCAFAGVSVGFLVFALLAPPGQSGEAAFWRWVTPIMLAFGALIGCGIAYVRGQTGLASDTVIGVFFAGSVGLAATLQKQLGNRRLFNLEEFLFGNPGYVSGADLIGLFLLTLVTAGILAWVYNPLLLSSFNHSLAMSRSLPVRRANYVFIILLAIVVNLCLRAVGVLLINALLIVPAATAFNLSRNLRQLFWRTILLCLAVSLAGEFLMWEAHARYQVSLGVSGTVVLLSVGLFFLSMVYAGLRQRWEGKTTHAPTSRER